MYTIEELIDIVQGELTMSCALPKALPDVEIRRIIENKAQPWFYQNYQYAVQKMYYHIDAAAFTTDEWTRYRYIQLPCEIQTITWIYPIRNISLFNLGINSPNLSINMGVTNQPYVSSYVTTIGDLGVYKAILSSFSDMLNQFSKYTIKFHYNQMANRLNILGTSGRGDGNTLGNDGMSENMIVECYANIESEALYCDPQFIKYVTGFAKQQLGNLYSRFDFTLAGGVKYNSSDLVAQGKEEILEVVEYVKGQSTTGWFVMTKK